MSEVVTFEQVRRRAQPWSGGVTSTGSADFFNRHELNQILQVYSRRVMSGEWLDYALRWDEGGAAFAIYGAASTLPVYTITKRPRHSRKSAGRYQVSGRGQVLKTAPNLAGVLAVLDRRRPELVVPA